LANPLYMVRLVLDFARLAALGQRAGLPPGHEDTGFLVHAAIAALFGEGEVQPFRVVAQGRGVGVVGYTRLAEDELRDRAQELADPAAYAASDWAQLAVKPMPLHWPSGRRLGFEVRTCPVVRLARPMEVGRAGAAVHYARGSELDAWLHSKLASNDPQSPGGREGVYGGWLRARIGSAATIEEARLEGFRLIELVRRDRTTQRRPHFLARPDALLRGVLTVFDGDAFGELLERGVGRHRAYGFGMMLLRAPS